MDSNNTTEHSSESEVLHEFLFFTVYKDGRITVFDPCPPAIIAPSDDPITSLKIKDVEISSDVSARIFLPPTATADNKVPVVFYVHGGGFCMGTTFSTMFTSYLTRLSADAGVLIVSVEYRIFTDHPIPACYEDSWTALQWMAIHSTGTSGPEPWLTYQGDLTRVFLVGESAGGNIIHTLAARAGTADGGVKLEGAIMVHPYFGEDDKMWMYMCPTNEGPQYRRMKPATEDLGKLGCDRVLVVVAEKDSLREAGKGYVEELKKSGWKGKVELVENKERGHAFYLGDFEDEEAHVIQRTIVSFINIIHE